MTILIPSFLVNFSPALKLKSLVYTSLFPYRRNIVTVLLAGDTVYPIDLPKEFDQKSHASKLIRFMINPKDILCYHVEFPAGIGRNWLAAVQFGITRWTPFDMHEVYLAAHRTEASSSKTSVEIRLALRKTVDPQIAEIEKSLRKPDILSFGSSTDWDIDVDTPKRKQFQRRTLIDACLLLSASALLIAGLKIYETRTSDSLTQLRILTENSVRNLAQERHHAKEISDALKVISSMSKGRESQSTFQHQLSQLSQHVRPPFEIRKVLYKPGTIRLAIEVNSDLHPAADWANLPQSYKIISMRPLSSKSHIIEIEHTLTQ